LNDGLIHDKVFNLNNSKYRIVIRLNAAFSCLKGSIDFDMFIEIKLNKVEITHMILSLTNIVKINSGEKELLPICERIISNGLYL